MERLLSHRSVLLLSFSLTLGCCLTYITAQERKPEESPQDRPTIGRDRTRPLSIADLILNPVVAKDLGLSLDQQQSISNAAEEAAPNRSGLRAHLMNANTFLANGSGDQERVDRALAAMEDTEWIRSQIVKTRLTAQQYRRLLQIAIQRKGVRAIAIPDVAEAIGMSPDQLVSAQIILHEREAEFSQTVARRQEKLPPATQAHYDRVSRKASSGKTLSEDDRHFLETWMKAAAARREVNEAFEDRIDARIFRLLDRKQRERFQRVIGLLLDIDRPIKQAAPEPENKAGEKKGSPEKSANSLD